MAEALKPHIGKNVIETLTLGMYDDSRFVFREYVQNAADQIDVAFESGILAKKSDGRIIITIDRANKKIVVDDNATGIASKNVTKFLGDVANSQKDRDQRKGFRGIGRLGGLGYCNKLVFETSALNEPIKSTMSLDALMLRNIIEDRDNSDDAASVISVITSITQREEAANSHYFRITLEGVRSDKLLDEESIKEYLSMVAPLPFRADFKCKDEINNYYKKNNYILDEYFVKLNGTELFKPYKDKFVDELGTSELLGVEFFQVRDDDSELLGLGWFGFRNLSNVVLPVSIIERGIRLRKNNISIGDEGTLKRFFKAERTNLRFIGELHAISNSFIPNARRDYFNENNTLKTFERKLDDLFKEENWENRAAQAASQLHNRVQDVKDFQQKSQQYGAMKFESEAEQTAKLEELRQSEKRAKDAVKVIERFEKNKTQDRIIEKLFNNIVANEDLSFKGTENLELDKFDPPVFKKLKGGQQQIVRDIFAILDKHLNVEDAKKIKTIIFEKYN